MFFDPCDFHDSSVRANMEDNIQECEMWPFDSAYLCGLIKLFKPKHILEIGVSAGDTSAIILNALHNYKLNTKLTSLDLNVNWYRQSNEATIKKTGWHARELCSNPTNWTLLTGAYAPQFLELLNTNFDFLVLDTVHMIPGEILDYLCAIKYMQLGSCIVIHDIQLFDYSLPFNNFLASHVLYDVAVGEKFFCRNSYDKLLIPNIGAFRMNSDTIKYIDNTFSSLAMPWGYLLTDDEFNIYKDFF